MILLRGFLGRPPLRAQALLNNNLPQLEEFLVSGSIVAITDSRIRVQPLLITLKPSTELPGEGA